MNRTALLVGGLIVVPLLALLAVAFRFDPRTVDSPLVGKEAPNFRLYDLDGQLYELEQLRGQPVVLNFWSTWCPPCISEHPLFRAAAQRYRGRAHFLGVIYQDEIAKIEQFNRELGTWGPSLVDSDSQVAIAYGVYGPPETFFIDKDGVIIEKILGEVHPDVMVGLLERLL